MKKQLFSKKYVKYIVLAIAILLLLVVPLFRAGLPGTESYLNLRLADDFSLHDDLSFGGRFASYHLGTPFVFSFIPEILVTLILIILGILSLLLLREIIKEFTNDKALINIASLFYVVSPAFIYLFTSFNDFFLPFFIALLIFYLFNKEKIRWLNIILISILPFFSITITGLLLISLFFYVLSHKKDLKVYYSILFLFGAIISILYYGYMLYRTGVPIGISLQPNTTFSLFRSIIFDLGSYFGIAIFTIITAFIGFGNIWKNKYENLFAFFSIIFLFLLVLYRVEALIFLNLFFVVFAAIGFIGLLRAAWSSLYFKNLIIFIILVGIIFSGFSQVQNLIDSDPSKEMLDGLNFLSTQEQGVVFSDQSRGIWLNWAGHKNVMDENSKYISDAQERLDDSQIMLFSRDIDVTNQIVNKYNIKYIWIDKDMKDSIWEYDTEGLLFIVQNTKSYNKIYDKEGIEIWRIEG